MLDISRKVKITLRRKLCKGRNCAGIEEGWVEASQKYKAIESSKVSIFLWIS